MRDLSRGGLNIEHLRVENADDMRDALAREMWDLIISDYTMPQFSAAGALSVLKESGLDVPLIVISGTIGEDRAVALLKEGASDFVSKDMLARLVSAIQRELREASTRRARPRRPLSLGPCCFRGRGTRPRPAHHSGHQTPAPRLHPIHRHI